MPQIKEYTAENDVLRPSGAGIETRAQAARRIGSFYSQAGETIKRGAEDIARAAESTARAGEARAQAAGELASFEQKKAGAYGTLAQTAGTAVEAAEAFAGHQEVSAGAKNFAQAQEQLTKQWNSSFDQQAKSDPNNTTINQTFMKGRFEQWADSYTKGFITPQGRDWAEQQVNHLRNHLTEKTSADMSTMAGVAVKSNLDKIATSLSNTAANDPSSVQMMVGDEGKNNGQIDRMVGGIVQTNPHLRGSAAVRAQTEYTDSMKRSVIEAGAMSIAKNAADPEAAVRDYTSRFPSLISAQDADKIVKGAMYFKRLNDTEARAQKAQQDADNKKDFNSQVNALEASMLPKNVGDAPQVPADAMNTLRKLSTHPGATGEAETNRLRAVITQVESLTERLNKPPPLAQVSHDTAMELLPQIRQGGFGTESAARDAVAKAYGEGKLDNTDFGFLNKAIADSATPYGQHVNDLRSRLEGAAKEELGKYGDSYYRWQWELDRRMDNLQRAGKDPLSVFDPDSKDYMGGRNTMVQFLNPMGQRVQENGGVGTPAAPTKTVPPALRGIAALQHNKDWTRFRDEATGKVYDAKGAEIKQ